MMIYVSIGNSDDKLSQEKWAAYWRRVDTLIRSYARRVHGAWVSESTSPYQNACWCLELNPEQRYVHGDGRGDTSLRLLQDVLRDTALDFGQDSIAWAEVRSTTFLSHTDEKGVEHA